jgi:hypothetical protein
MFWRGMLRPGMRAYLIPFGAGVALAMSAFLPWVVVGGVSLAGFPDVLALWILGLGALASTLAVLSLITRRNSRHPLLLIGLVALGITFLSSRIMPRSVADRALTRSQAVAIVENRPPGRAPSALAGSGLYLGIAASCVLVGFGLTIVVKRVGVAYKVADPNDDVE